MMNAFSIIFLGLQILCLCGMVVALNLALGSLREYKKALKAYEDYLDKKCVEL